MAEYITVPIVTNPDDLAGGAFDYLQSVFPGWVPNDGNLDTIVIESMARMVAEARDVASSVPTTIFRYFGGSIINLLPLEDTPASGTTTWTARNNAGYTIEAGTLIGLRATGDTLLPFEVVSTVVIPPGSTATAAGAVAIRAVISGTDSNALSGAAELIDSLDWVLSIAVVGSTSGGVEAEEDSDYLNRLTEYLQLLSPRPIIPSDFEVLSRTIAGVERALAIDGYNPNYNALTANQASAETDATGFANMSNTTIGSTAAQAADGTKSVSMTAIAAAAMDIRTPQAAPPAGGSMAVVPGETWTGLASIRANTTVRSCQVMLGWYDAAGAFLSWSTGTAANDSNTGWTVFAVTGNAPANAAFVILDVKVGTAAIGEVHYVDKAALHRGTSITWAAGGTVETNNERMISIALIDAAGETVSGAIKTAVDTMLQSEREVNFIVSIIDPNYCLIDVNVTYKALTGYTIADVNASVTAALQDFLSPANWGRDSSDSAAWINRTTLRYLELATTINNVLGVDYITALTFGKDGGALGTADVTLPGTAPLPRPDTISVTGT